MKIKLLSSIIGLTMMISPVQAQEQRHQLCPSMGRLADSIMKGRQEGLAMSDMMGLAGESEVSSLVRKMVIMAFEEPRYHSEEGKLRATQDFRAKIETICYK